MGAMGKYIDLATDEARDRIITAQDWCYGTLNNHTGRCLVGHGNDVGCTFEARDAHMLRISASFLRYFRLVAWEQNGKERRYFLPANQFDSLCKRRGLAVAVAMVKKRAAKNYTVPITISPPTREDAMT